MNGEFDDYYQLIYGERWPLLRDSLLKPSKPVPYSEKLLKPYMLDYASILAAMTLRLPKGGLVLDACAAPGGKSLVISSLMDDATSLISNEFSNERRRRLCAVLDEHLDKKTRQQVKVSGFDAAKQGGRKTEIGRYDAILLDAPCSSERHVIQDKNALAKWSPKRPRFLSQRQWSLLSSAFLLLKEGGSLVYITCAISPLENDSVAERLFKKYQTQVLLDPVDLAIGENTQFGKIILPDQWDGMGPMYVARFIKTREKGDK